MHLALGTAPAVRAARVVTWTAAALSAVTAYVHFAYTESHFEEWWAYGVLFLIAGQLQAVLALALLRRPPAWVLVAGALVNLGIVGVYVASRTSGLPFGPHANVAERAGAVDLGTTAAEIVLVGLLISLARAPRAALGGQRPAPGGGGAVGAAPHRQHRLAVGAAVLAAVALVLAVGAWVAEPLRIPSDSMAPTLRPGDHVLVDKTAYRRGEPRRGDLAVVRAPGSDELMLKRVVALGGQTVGIEDGVLVVDGRRPPEPYVDHDAVDSVFFGPVRVPRGSVFVLGDNRADSVDSRRFGALPQNALVGRVATRLWPPAR